MSKLSHLDDEGRAAMVDVSAKGDSERIAAAEALIVLSQEAFDLIVAGDAPKGDVLATARIAGIMAAKKTSELIPLCHPLALSHVGIAFTPLPERAAFRIVATAKTTGPTGVEMEALTAAGIAALTIYDMVKAVDRSARIEFIHLLSKSGGKSGSFERGRAKAHKTPTATTNSAGPPGSPSPKSSRPAPRVLGYEAAAPRVPTNRQGEREALRAFMLAHRLRASDWAKSAEVPVNELYAFLNGRARALSDATSERLARVARTNVAEMFGRKAAR